jgi:pimeloyl-ACP methyl ester carboxylesterase
MLLTVQEHETYCYTGGKKFDASLPTAVFIHGAQNDHSVWALQTRYFAHHGYNVLAVDLPGHGRSQGAALTSVEAMADWILALLERAGVPQAILVGHSMGSLIALETAFRSPAKVAKLALVATAYPMKVSETLLDAALNDEQKAFDMVNLWSHSSIAQKPSFPGPGFYSMGGALRLKQRISKINPEHVFYTDFKACDSYANGEQAAASVKCPVLFLLGERDLMTSPKATGTLISNIAHCKVIRIAASGHELMAEQPDSVLDAFFSFAKSPI